MPPGAGRDTSRRRWLQDRGLKCPQAEWEKVDLSAVWRTELTGCEGPLAVGVRELLSQA